MPFAYFPTGSLVFCFLFHVEIMVEDGLLFICFCSFVFVCSRMNNVLQIIYIHASACQNYHCIFIYFSRQCVCMIYFHCYMYLNTTRYYPPFVRQISRRLVCTTGHTMLFSQMGATVIVLLLAVASCHETGLEAERKLRGGFVAFCVTRSFLYLFFLLRSP